MFQLFYSLSSSSEVLKQDDLKSTLTTEEMTTSDDELRHDFFGGEGEGEWPVGQDITGPALVSMPAPPASNQNIFAHVDDIINVHRLLVAIFGYCLCIGCFRGAL